MNRQTKRMLQKQGEIGPDGEPVRAKAQQRPAGRPPKKERTTPQQYVREVKGELRKVAWPDRNEVVRYSTIVLITLVLVTLYILGLDLLFAEAVARLFGA